MLSKKDPYYQEMLQMVKDEHYAKAAFWHHMQEEQEKYYYRPPELTLDELISRKEKTQTVAERRSQIDMEMRKYNVFNLSKWNFLRQIREDQTVHFYKLYKRMWAARQLVIHAKAAQILRFISEVHKWKVVEFIRHAKAVYLTLRVKQAFQRLYRVRGRTVTRRN